jgi:DNA-binding LacI/PurR family transcriptional regulator
MDKNEPKYVLLARQLKDEIELGNLQPGDSLPTFKELRQNEGISQFTYERAYDILKNEGLAVRLRGRYGGVFVAPRKLAVTNKPIGYFHFNQGEQLALPYWSHLLDGIRQALAPTGQQVLLVDDLYSFTGWDDISAALVVGWRPQQVKTFRQHAPAALPVVSLLMDAEGVPSVIADEYGGTYEMVRTLLELGHTNIGFMTDQPTHHISLSRRKEGYLQALLDHGITPQMEWFARWEMLRPPTPEGYHAFGRETMATWLENGFRETGCTALLTQNDHMAYGVYAALTAAQIKVPEEISVIGFDGVPSSTPYLVPRLTTLEMPLREIGMAAVNSALAPALAPQTLTLPVRVRMSDTTAAPPKNPVSR